MASALLALSQPIYAGLKNEQKFIRENPDKVGKAGSLKRLKSIPYAFSSFGEGFIKAGGGERLGKQLVGSKKHGGMNCPDTPMLRKSGAFARETPRMRTPAVHSAMGGGHILAFQPTFSPQVLGHLPPAALMRERHRAGGDLRRPIMG